MKHWTKDELKTAWELCGGVSEVFYPTEKMRELLELALNNTPEYCEVSGVKL